MPDDPCPALHGSGRLRDTSGAQIAGVRPTVIVAGQSNAVGQGKTADLTNTQRINIGNAYSNVTYRQKSAQGTRPDPIVWSTDQAGSLVAFSSTLSNNQGCGVSIPDCVGPMLSMGRHLDYYAASTYNLANFSISGTTLETEWCTTCTYPTSPGGGPNIYTQLITFMQAYRPAAFVWIQGESDATVPSAAASYQANLTTFLTGVRANFPNIPIVIARLNSQDPAAGTATVQAAEAAACALFAGCVLVNTDHIPLSGDNLHYNADGYAQLGDLLASNLVTIFGLSSPVAWTIDPVSLIGIPASNTEWTAVMGAAGIASGNPQSCWRSQEASGTLADSCSAGLTLTASGTGITYNAFNGGWGTLGIKVNEGSTAKFATTSASLPDPSTTSQARLLYANLVPGSAVRNVFLWGTAGFTVLQRDATPTAGSWKIADGGNVTSSSTVISGTFFRPWIIERKRTVTTAFVGFTDNSNLVGTIGTVTGKQNTIGTGTNPLFQWTYDADFYGTNAELSTAQWRTLLQTLNWANSNLGAAALPW